MKNIKNISCILFIFSLLVFLSSNTFAGTGSLSVNATVISSASVTEATALDFGSFALTDSGATGTRLTSSYSGSESNIDEMVAPTSGVVNISGAASTVIYISVGGATLTGPGSDMTAVFSAPASVTTNASGAATATIEGSLSVNASQTAGSYSGTATVTVNY